MDQFNIAKLDTDRNLVFGWASIAARVDGQLLIDKQGDIIPPEELETAAYEYVLEFREADEMHSRVTKGHLVESLVTTPEKLTAMGLAPGALPVGWWVGFKMDAASFAAVKSGKYPMFSIEGTAERVEVVGKYDPSQPRDPAGSPTGGQWTSGGGRRSVDGAGNDPRTLPNEHRSGAMRPGEGPDLLPFGGDLASQDKVVIQQGGKRLQDGSMLYELGNKMVPKYVKDAAKKNPKWLFVVHGPGGWQLMTRENVNEFERNLRSLYGDG